MADSTIDISKLVLACNRISAPTASIGLPTDGFTGSNHFNVATPAYPLGTTVQVQQTGVTGQAGITQFTYLKVGTQTTGVAIAAKTICVQASTTPLVVTNDKSGCIALGGTYLAVALAAMTDGYYGWFWTGGVCPVDFVAALTGNVPTNSNVIAGPVCAVTLVANAIGVGPVAAATQVASGFATASDA